MTAVLTKIRAVFATVVGALGGWQGYAAAAGVAFVLGFGGCWKLRDWMEAAAKLKAANAAVAAARHVVAQAQKQDQVSNTAGVAHQAADVTLQDQGRKIAQEIPVHVTPEISNAYPLPAGAVRVLNDAIGLSAVPDAPSQSDDARSGVTLAGAVPVLSDDLVNCRRNAQQLTDLQGWVTAQQDLARADGR